MKFLTSKNVSLGVLAINIIFMIVTLTHLSREKIVYYAAGGTPRALFFISAILSVAALVYTIMEKKKGKQVNLIIPICNIVIAILLLILPSIALATVYNDFYNTFG